MTDGRDLDVKREVVVLIPLLGLEGLHANALVLIISLRLGYSLSLSLVFDLLRRVARSLGLRNGVGDETANGGVALIVLVRGTLLALALTRGRGLGGAGGAGASGLVGGGRGSTVVVAVAVGMALAELLDDLLGPLLGWASLGCQLCGAGTR